MRAAVTLLAALLAVLGVATATEYPIAGEVAGPFEVKVMVNPGTGVDTREYAVLVGDKYVHLIMVEKEDLLRSPEGKFKTQPFLVPVPKEYVEVDGPVVRFPNGLNGTFAAYCLNPTGRHPRGEMVVPRWEEIKDRLVEIKVVTLNGVRTEERHLTPRWVKAVCERVENVVDPGEWKREAQTALWVTEAAIPEEVRVKSEVQIDVSATVRVNARDFFRINESELKQLAEFGDEMARQLLEFFSDERNLESLIDTAQSALDFVKRHLSDLVTVARTAKEAYETVESALSKVPVLPAVITAALTVPILRRRPPIPP
ncbi:hypothetical protein [Methanopyrus sp.]